MPIQRPNYGKEAEFLAQCLAEFCLSYSEVRENDEPCGCPYCPGNADCSRVDADDWLKVAQER